jgi:V/A-type H+-transporting ATPase subunit E
MMQSLETGKDKIQRICDAIRKETLEPVKKEASELIENANTMATKIVADAQKEAAVIKKKAEVEAADRLRDLKHQLDHAAKLAIETLKQKIETSLFSKELGAVVAKEMAKPELIVKLVESFMRSLEMQGIEEDFQVVIPAEISARSINALLAKNILERIRGQSVQLDGFEGGVKLVMKDREITIDITNRAVQELLAAYIRRDLRELVFVS